MEERKALHVTLCIHITYITITFNFIIIITVALDTIAIFTKFSARTASCSYEVSCEHVFFILLNWSVRPRYTTSVLPYGQLNYGGMKARKIGRIVNILRTILLCLIVSPLIIESLKIFLSFFLYFFFYGELTL